jgi:hypothetical protein
MRIKMIQASLAAAAVLVPMAVASGHVEAKSHPDPIRITWDFNNSVSSYTDCPVLAPADVDCVGTQIYVEQLKKRVGRTVTRTSRAEVYSVVVHFHADGSFQIEPVPFATGSGPVRLDFDDLEKAQVRGTVPMSDGSVAEIRVKLAGVGPVTKYSGSGASPESACPSGSSDLTWEGAYRNASVVGAITVGTSVQNPTEAIGPAFILEEQDEGACTPV